MNWNAPPGFVIVKLFGLEKSKESKELVTVPVTTAPPVAPAELLGVTFTVDVVTGGLRGSPLLETPTPVTLYSHPVLISIEFIVSVTVELVSVLEVMLPCWKLGTTGTAFAVLTFARTNAPTTIASTLFITHANPR